MSAPPSTSPRMGDLSGILRPGVTLLVLFGLAWLSFQGFAGAPEGGRLSVRVGFVLLAASVAGALAVEVGLPRITGFILVGMGAGPSLSRLLGAPAVSDLRLIDDFALALIAMLAGGELRVGALRPQGKAITLATLCVTGLVWVGVAATVLGVRPFVPFLARLPWTAAAGVSLLLGVWAANSSPDLTVAVIEERGSRGQLADVILGVTIVKDVLVIVLFTLTLSLVTPLLDPTRSFSAHALVDLAREVGGALALGAAGGWIFSRYLGDERDRLRSPLATFLFAYVLVVLSKELHVELLLAGVAAGFAIENASPAGERMIQGIRSVAVVIFALFFAIAGAGLDLGSVLRFGPLAALVLLVRGGLTRLGARLGLRLAAAPEDVRDRAWLGLVSQGGVSLGLALLILETFPGVGEGVVSLAMAVIVGNILAGPVLLGRALTPRAPGVAEPA
jgi:Kef-type K+ transport system membrane component KefB